MRFYPVVTYLSGRATFYEFWPEANYNLIPRRETVYVYPPVDGKDVHEAATKWADKRFMPNEEFIFSEDKKFILREGKVYQDPQGKVICSSFVVYRKPEKA